MTSFKGEERILKATREKQGVTYNETPIRLAAAFSIETLQEILQVMKRKGLQLRLLYPARISIRMEGKIRSFPDKRRLK